MKKALLFTLFISQLFFYNQCTEVKEKIGEENRSFELEEERLVEKKSEPLNSEASIIPSFNSVNSNNAVLEKTTLDERKKIPFRKLFVRNITFTENKGQLERFGNFYCPELDQVKYYTKAFNGTAYFANNGIGFGFQRGGLNYLDHTLNQSTMEKLSKSERREALGFFIEFENCNKEVQMQGIEEQATKLNYLKGSDPNAFITDIVSYEQLRYKELYKGIDLLYYTKDDQLKYDYILSAGAKVGEIRMKYKGVKDIAINKKGELEINIDWGVLYDKKPYSYQIINGEKKEVEVIFKKLDKNTIGFEVKGKYDKSRKLVIDPYTVQWSTYIGSNGPGFDNGYIEATTVDNSGRVLGTGWSNSSFPINASATGYDKLHNGAEDVFVFRLQGDGSTMDYVSYIGGSGWEVGTGIGVNSAGEICVGGYTQSYGQSALIKTSTTSLTIGTGPVNVNVSAIAGVGFGWTVRLVNGANYMEGTITGFPDGATISVNVTSTSGSGTFSSWDVYQMSQLAFPTTAGSTQPVKDGVNSIADIFYVKLGGAGNTLNYGTHYGGTDTDWALDLVLDNNDNAYMTGRTQSASMATAGAFKTALSGGFETFIMKVNADNSLGYFTYIGGAANDIGKSVAVNTSGEAYITGMTGSIGLSTAGVYQTANAGGEDAFVTRINSAGSALVYYTYLGGTSRDIGGGIKLIDDDAVVVGTTVAGSGFPTVNAYSTGHTADEAFLTRVNATGSALVYSTYLGGNGTDNAKGADYAQYHKSGGIEIVQGMPVVVISSASTAGMPTVDPFTFTAVQNDGTTTYLYDGSTFKGGTLGDMYVIVMDETAQNVLFGSYYGGSENDYPTAGVNADRSNDDGCIIIAGGVHSIPFPTTVGAFQTRRFNSVAEDQHVLVKICLPEILPVELLEFNGFWNGEFNKLNWTTASEKNSDYFIVERSADGVNFFPIGQVKAAGNSSELNQYSFFDTEPADGNNYYRLKQYDLDATFHYSKVINIGIGEGIQFIVSPNPGDGLYHANGSLIEAGEVTISVMNDVGQEVLNQKEYKDKGSCQLEIDLRNFADGMYVLKITSGEFYQVEKLRKE